MVKFTNEQRLEIIKNYYQSSESVVKTLRALTPILGRNNLPTRQAVRAIVNKFESTYSLLDVPVPVRQRSGRSTENIAAVSASVRNEPNQSISQRSQELGISQSTLWRILRQDLGIHEEMSDSKIRDEHRSEIKKLKQDKIALKERRLSKKRIAELDRPKKPPSAFLLFIAKERISSPQSSSQTYRDWQSKITAKWASFTDEQKEMYFQECRQKLEKYKKDIVAWEEKMVRLGNIDVVRHEALLGHLTKRKQSQK